MHSKTRSFALLSTLVTACALAVTQTDALAQAGGTKDRPETQGPPASASARIAPKPTPKLPVPTPPPPQKDPPPKAPPPKTQAPPVTEAPTYKASGIDRWVEATPDALVAAAARRVDANADDAVGGLLLIAAMNEFASPGEATRALSAIARGRTRVAVDAAGLLAALTPAPFGKAWTGWANVAWDVPADASGHVKAVTVIGPFQDTGGGLARREGPEAPGESFANAKADYSWGDFEVKPRRVVPDWVTGAGVPLDMHISPKNESCTYVASRVNFPKAPSSIVLRVASTGAARVVWDGVTLVADDHVHARAALDRFAIAIEPTPGDHLVAVKTCSTALPDEGRVRIRFTDAAGVPVEVAASSDLAPLPQDRAASADAAAPPAPAPGAKSPAPGARPGDKLLAVKPTAKAPPAPKTPAVPQPVKTTPKFTVEKTALARALDAETASNDHALTSALVRGLAGADDTRSPRITGLLDKVTKDAAVTPNQLALAGWLSSFGANKSAWLNLAMERGRAASDTSTVSFAQRRLIEALLAGGGTDSAMRLMEREPFAKEEDVSARVLRAGHIARVRSALDAYQLLANLDLELKQRIPTVALRELAGVSGSNPEARLTYLRRLAQVSPSARGDALVHAVGGIDGSVAAERTIAQALPFATSSRSLVAWSGSLERRGRVEWARELAFVATKVAPNLPESWEALATARDAVMLTEKKAGKPATDDPSHASRARERALALRRGDAGKKAEIAYRDGVFEGKKSNVKEKGADEAYLLASNTITERAKATPAKIGEAFERNLHFQRIVTYNDDRRVSQLIHQAREIVVEPRTQQELYERNIPYEGDEVELVFARVHRKDGTVAQPEEQSSVGAYIKWPQLRTGDIVEYAVRSWTSQPVGRRGDPPFYFIDYVGSSSTRPVLFNEVVVIAPESDQLGVDVINGKADRATDVVKDGKRVQTFTWDKPPVVADEPMAPAATENLPLVVGSTFRSWDDFRAWYRNAIEGFSEPDEQVKRLAAELTKGKKTEKEKLEALFNYVADDIRYVNYTSGEYWLPNRPQICLSRKQGDCDDKAILLIALLKSIGVTATPVLVQTRMTGMPSVLMATKAAAPLFDHGIAFLPGKNGAPGTWLDATSPESRLGPLPSMDARAKALFIYEGEAKIIDTPPGAVADNGVTSTWEVALDAAGGATIKGNEKHVGDWAFELRRNLKETDARAQWVESYLSRWVPTMDLAPEIPYSADAGTLGYSVKAEGFARSEGDEWALASLGAYSFMANFASLPQRTLPVVLPPFMAPSHQRRTMTFTLPAGFEWKPLPPGGEAKGGPFGLAKVSFKTGRTPRSVVVETEIVFDKSTITVAEYPAFRKWLESVDALIRQTARYQAVGGAKPKAALDDDASLRPVTKPPVSPPNTKPTANPKPGAPPNPTPKPPATVAPKK
jgi:hypothetical protein